MNNIKIHQGNRLELLADRLAIALHERRRHDFSLEPDVVLVNNREMAQWLSIKIAGQEGICANIRFSLFGSFAWSLASGLMDAGEEVSGAGELRWMVFRVLDEVVTSTDDPLFEEIRRYAGEYGDAGMYQLAIQLADLFDRYLNYRFDMLERWASGLYEPGDGWQPAFWNMLSAISRGRFRADRLVELVERIRNGVADVRIPDTIYLFGVSYLPPLHIDLLSALSSSTVAEMFILSPCRHYWLDTVSRKTLARVARDSRAWQGMGPDHADAFFPTGNRLLSSFGYAGRSFLASLYCHDPGEGRDFFRSCREDGKNSLLSMIQDDILEMRENRAKTGSPARTIMNGDRSLSVNSCHSPLREVEVLHDNLVEMFESDRDLHPHDILVMAPSMEKYAPFVEAVFGSAPAERFIPFSIADIGFGCNDPAARAFLSIVALPTSDFTATDIMDMAEQPCVAARMGFDSSDLPVLREWVRKSGIRRGIDRISPCPDIRQNTWLFGLDRLFISSCMAGTDMDGVSGIMPMPFPVEGADYSLLALFSGFFFSLVEVAGKMADGNSHTPDEWFALFMEIIREFISDSPDTDSTVQPLVERLREMRKEMNSACITRVKASAMRIALEKELGRPAPPRSFISGNVLFSSLVPMRSIPFRVISLLGMNDADFPRRPALPAFDLMVGNWRPGDRVPREEDRYLFLETLMSARERLIISYEGRRETDNSPQNPSVVVSELLDYISEEFVTEEGEDPAGRVVTQYPLQPFSSCYLTPDGPVSFAAEWLPYGRRERSVKKSPPPLFSDPLPRVTDGDMPLVVSPSDFAGMFENPAGFLLKKRLSINIFAYEELLDDLEPFSLSGAVDRMFIDSVLSLNEDGMRELHENSSRFLNRLRRAAVGAGMLPVGTIGRLLWENEVAGGFDAFISGKVLAYGLPCGRASVDTVLPFAGGERLRITGTPGKLGRDGGLLEYMLRVYDGRRLSLWIRHLLLAAGGWNSAPSVIVTGRTDVEIRPVDAEEAEGLLVRLAQLYVKGLCAPLPLFPSASWAFAKSMKPARRKQGSSGNQYMDMDMDRMRQKAEDAALKKVFHHLNRNRIVDPWVSYLYRGQAKMVERTVKSREFREVAMETCGKLLDYLKKGR